MAGVWLVVLASSSTLYGKVPRLILKKRSRLTQQVVSFSQKHFLFGALLCNRSSAEREGLSTHTCVCVCVFSCHLYRKSSSLDVPAGVTQEKGPTGFHIHHPSAVHAFIFLAREGFSRSFPSSTVRSNFLY